MLHLQQKVIDGGLCFAVGTGAFGDSCHLAWMVAEQMCICAAVATPHSTNADGCPLAEVNAKVVLPSDEVSARRAASGYFSGLLDTECSCNHCLLVVSQMVVAMHESLRQAVCEMACLLVSLAVGGSLTKALQADLTLPEEARDFLREHLHKARLTISDSSWVPANLAEGARHCSQHASRAQCMALRTEQPAQRAVLQGLTAKCKPCQPSSQGASLLNVHCPPAEHTVCRSPDCNAKPPKPGHTSISTSWLLLSSNDVRVAFPWEARSSFIFCLMVNISVRICSLNSTYCGDSMEATAALCWSVGPLPPFSALLARAASNSLLVPLQHAQNEWMHPLGCLQG